MHALETRIERLERQVLRWRLFTVLALFLLGGLLFLSMSPFQEKEAIPPVLKTRRLEIYSPQGRTVFIADAEDRGNGFLCLMNREGKEVFKIGVAECPNVEDSGFVAVHGQAARIVLDGTGKDSTGVLELGTEPLFFRGRSPETAAFLTLHNTQNKAGVIIGCEEITARDKSGKKYFRVYLDERGRCHMTAPKRTR